MLINIVVGAIMFLASQARSDSTDGPISLLKQKMQRDEIEQLDIYLIDWLTRTREAISPQRLVKQYDVLVRIRAPRFDKEKVGRLKESVPLSGASPDVRVGMIFYGKRGRVFSMFFGYSKETAIVNGHVVRFDQDLIENTWGFFPWAEKEKIARHFAEFAK